MAAQLARQLAGALAKSRIIRPGKQIFSQSEQDLSIALSKWEKLISGIWLILNDYQTGRFPPQFPDRKKAYEAERLTRCNIPGVSTEAAMKWERAKPFHFGKPCHDYLSSFSKLIASLERINLLPPSRILELGCGSGWMCEFLMLMGYHMVGTSISEFDIEDARKRAESVNHKLPDRSADFIVTPMETVHQAVPAYIPFDCVFVFEALHHAFSWQETLASAYQCLRPDGWFLICSEPNWLHTFISYRVARLTNTHEIGFRQHDLVQELRRVGFREIQVTSPKLHFYVKHHWILARK